jgi:hypothetical protein
MGLDLPFFSRHIFQLADSITTSPFSIVWRCKSSRLVTSLSISASRHQYYHCISEDDLCFLRESTLLICRYLERRHLPWLGMLKLYNLGLEYVIS